MHAVAFLLSLLSILTVLWEVFETVVLPRRVQRKFRITRFFYIFTWVPYRFAVRRLSDAKLRETWLSFYGPLSLVTLFAAWAVLLVVAFGLMQWGLGSKIHSGSNEPITFLADLYMSGTTLFTLGPGDLTPLSGAARFVSVTEAAIGFGLIALVISYLPTMYQAFARREVNISMLDSRAGSPPTAGEFRKRFGDDVPALYLAECERWAAELFESQMSYPALCYFRSQHANQSWLAAVTTVLDVCVAVEVTGTIEQRLQAELTRNMARHALVDMAKVFHLRPGKEPADRGAQEYLATLPLSEEQLDTTRALRKTYEPYAEALSQFLAMDVPRWS